MTESLGRLRTDLGEASVYDAVSQCSRCGYCLQACPTFVLTGKEAFSGRGRNQMVRLMLEGKLQDPSAAEEALSTCLLCGACTSACYAHVPTAELVLEGRRSLRGAGPPLLVRGLTRLLADRRGVFGALLKAGYFFKRLGLARLAAKLGVLRLFGLRALEEAELHTEEAPSRFLEEHLREDRELAGREWTYFAPCGPNYLLPRVGLATVKVLKRALGRGRFMENGCCGLLSYNYGSLDQAREFARRNISGLETLGPKLAGEAPVVGDCSSCVAFLKNYPQLFLGDPGWKTRAEAFSRRVKDAIEIPVPPALRAGAPVPHPTVTYHDSCRALNGQGLKSEPRAALRAACGEFFRELPESDWCCGGAGAFGFVHPELSDQVLRRKVSNLASIRARTVATSSTSCLLQLAHGTKKYYPDCRVVHWSEWIAENLIR